jgi:hypothetical protein
MVSHRFRFDQAKEALEAARRGDMAKIIFEM